jgi:uncharacterized protein YecT (DUF1311 family)
MMLSRIILVCAIITFAYSAIAKNSPEIEKRYSATYTHCMSTGDAALGVSPAMNACTWAEVELQERQLNRAYKQRMAKLGARQRTALRSDERRWIKLREKDCNAVYESHAGGSMAPLVYGTCMINTAIARTIWLEKYR